MTKPDRNRRARALEQSLQGEAFDLSPDDGDPVLLTLSDLADVTPAQPFGHLDLSLDAILPAAERVADMTMRIDMGLGGIGPVFMVSDPVLGLDDAAIALIAGTLAKHPDIHDASALPFFPLAVAEGLPMGRTAIAREALDFAAIMTPRVLGERYLMSSSNHRGERPRFIDRQPANLLFLPVIARAFPDAVFVMISAREPGDTWQRLVGSLPRHANRSRIDWPIDATGAEVESFCGSIIQMLHLRA